jgi:diphthamide biosynthesis methyltransferase
MTVPEALELLTDIDSRREEQIFTNTKAVGCARIATPTQQIAYKTFEELMSMDWQGPPQTLIIPGNLHEVEEDMLESWNK